jgi:hypothetical protein
MASDEEIRVVKHRHLLSPIDLENEEADIALIVRLPNVLQGLVGEYVVWNAADVLQLLSIAPHIASSLTQTHITGSSESDIFFAWSNLILHGATHLRRISIDIDLRSPDAQNKAPALFNDVVDTIAAASSLTSLHITIHATTFFRAMQTIIRLVCKQSAWPRLCRLKLDVHCDHIHEKADVIRCDWGLVSGVMEHIEKHAPHLQHLAVFLNRPMTSLEIHGVDFMELHLEGPRKWLSRLAQRLVSLCLDWPWFQMGTCINTVWPCLRAYVNRSETEWPQKGFELTSRVFPVLEALRVANVQLFDAPLTPPLNTLRCLYMSREKHSMKPIAWQCLASSCPNLESLYANGQYSLTCDTSSNLSAPAWNRLQVVHAYVNTCFSCDGCRCMIERGGSAFARNKSQQEHTHVRAMATLDTFL